MKFKDKLKYQVFVSLSHKAFLALLLFELAASCASAAASMHSFLASH